MTLIVAGFLVELFETCAGLSAADRPTADSANKSTKVRRIVASPLTFLLHCRGRHAAPVKTGNQPTDSRREIAPGNVVRKASSPRKPIDYNADVQQYQNRKHQFLRIGRGRVKHVRAAIAEDQRQ